MLVYIGIIAIVFCALAICRSYSLYVVLGNRELEAFLKFLKYMRGRVFCYLEPSYVWISSYSDKELSRVEFLQFLKDGESFKKSYYLIRGKLSLTEEADAVLRNFFESAGTGYRESEIQSIDYAIEKLENIYDGAQIEGKRKIKLVLSLICAFTMGLVILII